jgi:suppressor for copper-sensitivity B
VLLLALFLPPKLGYVPERAADTSAIAWQRFERGAIDMAVAEGKTVFVDVTADWCVTCQVNKRLVLSRAEIAAKLASDGVVALRADWTRPDPRIAAYLAEFGRYGIPFNAVYGPGAPGGLALPELLSAEAVLGALGQAAGR